MNNQLKFLTPYVYHNPQTRKKVIIHFCPTSKRPYLTKLSMAKLFNTDANAISNRISKYCGYFGFVPGSIKSSCYTFTDDGFCASNGMRFNQMTKPVYPTHLITSVFDFFNSHFYGRIENASVIRDIISYGCDNIFQISKEAIRFIYPFEFCMKHQMFYQKNFKVFIKTE